MADGKVVIETDLDSSGVEQGLARLNGIASKGLAVAKTAALATTAALTAAGTAAVVVGSNFEEGMSKVEAISGAAGEDLAKLEEKAKQMGATTKFSDTEAASAFEYMAMAGWKTEDMLGGIDGVMSLAAASGEDLALVSDIVTDAITAFGLSASDSGHFADVLAAASSNANTNVSMLGESFKYVAPIAGAMKYSVEDTSLALGLMANASVKGSMAGTSLKTSLANLASPTNAMAAVMSEYGISLTNADGSMKSLREVIEVLREKMGGLDEATQTAAASTLFGKEAMAGMLAVINASEADYQKLSSAVNTADGTAKNMADTMQDNLKGSITILKSSLEGLGIQVYEEIEGPLKNAAQKGIESTERISKAFGRGGFGGAVKEAGRIFDDLSDSISDTSDTAKKLITPAKNMMNILGSIGKTTLPLVSKSMKLLVKNMDTAVPLIVAGVTAFKSYNVISKAVAAGTKAHAAATAVLTSMERANALQLVATNGGLTLRQTLLAVYNGQITATTALTGLWTKAQTTLNAAMSANPVGLVVTVVAALTAGLAAYSLVTDSSSESTRMFTEEEEKLHKSIDRTAESIKEAHEARNEAVNGVLQESAYTESLADELRTIVDENGRVKEGYEARASFITSTLSEALGIEISLIDGQIQGYEDLSKSIDILIQKKKAEAVLNAYEDSYNEAVKNRKAALENLIKVSEDLQQAQSELAEVNAAATKELEENGAVSDATALKQAELNDKIKELSPMVEQAKQSYSDFNTTIQNHEGLSAAILEEDSGKMEAALAAIQANFKYYGQAMDAELKQQAVEAGKNMERLAKAIESGVVSASDSAVAEFANLAAKSLGELNKLPGGAAEAASQISPEMLGQLASLSGSLNEESKEAVKSFLEGLKSEDVSAETRNTFEQAVIAAVQGSEFGDELSVKAEEMGGSYLEALRAVLEVHSPSRAVRDIFAQVVPGAMEGADSGKEGLLEKGAGLVRDFLNGMGSGENDAGAQGIGERIMQFFGIGVSSQSGNSQIAGEANANAAKGGAASVNPLGVGTTFGSLISAGISGTKDILSQSGIVIANSAKAGASTIKPTKEGSNFGTVLAAAISGTKNILTSSGQAIANAAKGGADAVNPSPTGQGFGTIFASGILSKGNAARISGEEIANSAKSGLESVSAESAGKNFGSGFGGGISSAIGSAVNAAKSLASSALAAIKNTLDIHSPSKETTKLGEFTGDGMPIGIRKKIKETRKASEELAESALKGLDIQYQLGRMRAAMDAEKIAIGSAMTMRIVHEFIFNNQDVSSIVNELKRNREPEGNREIIQNINIYQPVRSPVETARALRRAGKELAYE